MSDESRIMPQGLHTCNTYHPGDVLIISNVLCVVMNGDIIHHERGFRTYPVLPINFDTLRPKEVFTQ